MTTTPDLWRSAFVDNATTAGAQDSGVVAATADDQFFAVWVDRNLNPDNIIARKFDSLGNPITGDVNLTSNSFLFFDTDQPAAVRLPIAGQADGLAVAFTYELSGNRTCRSPASGSPTGFTVSPDLYLVRTDAALNRIGNFITIDNSTTPTDHPSITSFSDGSLWVSYTVHNGANNWDINAKRIDPAGNVTTAITLFDPGSDIRADRSDLATLANGNFIAVFQRDESSGSTDNNIFFTIRTEAGGTVVSPTAVNGATDTAADEALPHVAALADGGFVVSWFDSVSFVTVFRDGSFVTESGIRAAVYDASGGLVQGNIFVNAFNHPSGPPGFEIPNDVTALPDGGFIVAWEDALVNQGTGVDRAQRFDEAGNLVGMPFVWSDHATFDINAATYSDGRAILTNSAGDVLSSIWDSRITDANQTTGENFFGPGGGPGDLLLIRDVGGVRQLEALQIENSNVTNAVVFGTVGTNQNFVGSGDFNGDGLSDLLVNVDNILSSFFFTLGFPQPIQTRTFLVDQMNPDGIQAQFQIAVRGADWIVDGIGDFNNSNTDDILVHRDVGGDRTLEVMVMNNFAVQSNVTIAVNGTNWDVDGIGDFNADGTSDILQHQINLGNETMTLRALSMSSNAVQVQSAPTLGTIGATWQVDGTGDFNHDGTSDILVHQDASNGVRTFQVLTIQNNAIVSATTIAQVGTNISVSGIGDFNHDGTSDIALHQDVGATRTDLIYNVVNNTVVNPHTVAVTGIDWHVA